ncbi:type VI secretion system-associated FHA domain protein TagH [Pseudomonas luteola]|uniref:type VI secretion system-associated FHA domain protein TagH n=1 Tax=Pseudomonas luteola TaxID=47886 RepID=UPI00388E126F
MELVFDLVSAQQFVPGMLSTRTFKQVGGIIGRAEDSDWVIPDRNRVLSGHHALVSYRDDAFYLTDTSSNGITLKDNGARLVKGQPHRIEHGNTFCLGDFEIRARLLQDPSRFDLDLGRPMPANSANGLIPDDAFLELDPLTALDRQDQGYTEPDELSSLVSPRVDESRADYARVDMESLTVPKLISIPEPEAAPQPEPVRAAPPKRQSQEFWDRYGQALGLDLSSLDDEAREALALNAARLLRQSMNGLQQTLRTRSEVKNELRLSLTTVQSAGNNPLKHGADSTETLGHMLKGDKPGQLPADQTITRAYRDLQAHQVALLTASRAVVKATLDQLDPEQLTLRFEREGRKPLFATAGSRWRAYRRHHHSLRQDGDWSERLFARDFATAYEEQVRLIATLNTDFQG